MSGEPSDEPKVPDPETDAPEHQHETPEEFAEEAEVAAWMTVDEIKELPHDARRLVQEGWDKIRHHQHHADDDQQPET
jgi:hypothetical protein